MLVAWSKKVNVMNFQQLRAVRGTRSVYHQNAIHSWKVSESGEVSNVQVF